MERPTVSEMSAEEAKQHSGSKLPDDTMCTNCRTTLGLHRLASAKINVMGAEWLLICPTAIFEAPHNVVAERRVVR